MAGNTVPTPIHVLPVIMAGGSGTRLWPLSRALYPKQFLAITGRETLFQQAAQRCAAIGDTSVVVGAPCVVGNEEHRFMVLDQLREIGVTPAALLLEPAGRNTAPALTLGALQAQADGADPVLVVAAADHAVTDAAAFSATLRAAVKAAADGSIVTLGIVPTAPETGFGYIRVGEPASGGADGGDLRTVAAFVEKPDVETARHYVADQRHLWNSGLFVLRASTWLKALRAFRPDILEATQAAWDKRSTDAAFVRPDKAAFTAVPSESIDYAVMERCPSDPTGAFPVKVLVLDCGWSDLGAWDAVWQVGAKDGRGNSAQGDAVFDADTRDTLVHATSRLVAAVGLDGIVIVETPDAVLVADRSRSQDVKQIVTALAASNRSEGHIHRRVHRPWGWYDSIDFGARFQVKRILVNPKATLSLQMHHHRAEHWIVVSGTAEVTNGDKVILLSENQSTYIPLGETHRLANPGTIPLEIIEVQSGSYLGEDDIVRFEDTYGRK